MSSNAPARSDTLTILDAVDLPTLDGYLNARKHIELLHSLKYIQLDLRPEDADTKWYGHLIITLNDSVLKRDDVDAYIMTLANTLNVLRHDFGLQATTGISDDDKLVLIPSNKEPEVLERMQAFGNFLVDEHTKLPTSTLIVQEEVLPLKQGVFFDHI